jgi:Ca2+-binding RTX toxin-like protein
VPGQRTFLSIAATAAVLAVSLVMLLPASGPATADTPVCQGETATIVGTDGANRLVGTSTHDVIVGLDGDDVIVGLGGNDLLCGGRGSDVISGGPGADKLYGGGDRLGDDVGGTFLAGDLLRGGSGNDLLVGGWDDRKAQSRRVPDTYSWTDAPRGVDVDLSGTEGVATGFGHDRIQTSSRMGVTGSRHGDTIVGSDHADTLQGGDGDDRITGGKGDDEILAERRGGSGNDFVQGGVGWDFIGSYAGHDEVRGGEGDDFVEAYGDQPASVRGDSGADQVAQSIPRSAGLATIGGGGHDVITLYGHRLEGHAPRLRFTVDLRAGTTGSDHGHAGKGTIGQYEEYRLVGNLRWGFNGSAGDDRVWAITGGELQAWTYGGRDWVHGSEHDDTINAGSGSDTVLSGGGHDTCKSAEHNTCRR